MPLAGDRDELTQPGRDRAGSLALLITVVLLGLFVVACQAVRPTEPVATAAATPSLPPMTREDAANCPTTHGGPGPSDSHDQFFGWGSSYGNGRLWVGGLWPDGVIAADPRFVDKDGRVGMKFGWWHTEAGKLAISGRRLDAPAPPAIGDVPDGYGATGFQASGVTFPTEGCWEITGSVGSTSLTFVTFVIKVASAPTPAPS